MAFTLAELEERLSDPQILDGGVTLPTDSQQVFEHCLALIERGELRAAVKNANGTWEAIPWVKRAITSWVSHRVV